MTNLLELGDIAEEEKKGTIVESVMPKTDYLGLNKEPSSGVKDKIIDIVGTDPLVGFKALYTGMKLGTYDFFTFLDKSAELVHKATGLSKGDVFKKIADSVKPSDSELSSGDIFVKIVRAAGAVPGTILKYALGSRVAGPVAGMAGVGAIEKAEEGLFPAVKGAIKEGTLGLGLKYTTAFKPITKAGITGTMFGTTTATEPGATTEDIITSTTVGMGLSGVTGGGKMSLRDLLPEMEGTRQRLLNRVASIENLAAEANKRGLKLKPGEDPGLGARTYPAIGMKFKTVMDKYTYRIKPDGQIEFTGEGLSPILKDYDKGSLEKKAIIREKDLDDYLVATRYIEDLQRPKGSWTQEKIATPQQIADSQAKLSQLTNKYGNLSHLEQTAGRLYSFQQRVLQLLVDSGNLSKEQYQNIITANPHYVPFQRIMDDIDPSGGILASTRKPFTEARGPIGKIMGSERETLPAMESIIKNTFRIVDTAHRNTVWRNVYKLKDLIPETVQEVHAGVFPIKVSPNEIKTSVSQFVSRARQVSSSTQTAGGPNQPSSAPIARLENIIVESLKLRGMTEPEALNAVSKIKQASGAGNAQQNTQTTIKEMVTRTVKVLKEPVESTIFRPSQFKPKGNVVEGYDNGNRKYIEVSQNLYDAMTGLTDISLGMFTKVMSLPARTLRVGATITPEFISRNFLRDQWTAFMHSRLGFRPFVDPAGAIADILGKNDTYYKYLVAGGGYSTFTELSHDNLRKMLSDLRGNKSLLGKFNIITKAEEISQLIEMLTRVGVFKAELRRGTSPLEAGGKYSRESTVDFALRGSKTKDINSMTAFFNAGIQSGDKMVRAFRNDPIGMTSKGLATITIPEMISYLRYKEDKDWKETAQWRKDLFWPVHKNSDGSFVVVPKPFFYGQLFGSSVGRFLEYLDKEDPEAFKGMVKSLVESATPVQGDPSGVLLVTALKPLIENVTDWNFFQERPLLSEWEKKTLPYQQYKKYTTEFSRQVGKLMGEMPVTSLLFKDGISPAKVDNLVQGWLGGAGAYALRGASKVLEMTSGEQPKGKRPRELADYPLLQGFVTRPSLSQPKSLYDFYENSAQIERAYNSYTNSLKSSRTEDAQKIIKKYPNLFLSPDLNKYSENINALNQQIYLLSSDPNLTDEIKRKEIRVREELRLKLAVLANRMMKIKPKEGQ